MTQALSVVHIFISGKPTKNGLPQHPDQSMPAILASACCDFFQKQVIFRSAWARLMAVHIATVDIVTHVLRSSAAVAFLVGPDGSWINGQVLRANGGMV
jgi:hypothetical protein